VRRAPRPVAEAFAYGSRPDAEAGPGRITGRGPLHERGAGQPWNAVVPFGVPRPVGPS
jgi:hypothetical protein